MNIQAVKRAVRQRDGQRCVECGMTDQQHRDKYGRSLDVHRKVPGSVYTIAGCETLCKRCHGPKPKQDPWETGAYERPVMMRLSRTTIAALDRAARRLEITRTAVVERLSVFADDLTPETLVPAARK